jgi:5'-nucleotidase
MTAKSHGSVHAKRMYLFILFFFFVVPLAVVVSVKIFSKPPAVLLGSREAAQSERRITFLTVNDIYRLDGVSEGGGLTRLRTLRKWIERDAPNAILIHAGDFLAPSLISNVFKGEQMIDVMNHLDGEGRAFDPRMFVAIGNHEFDDSRCDRAPAPLMQRLEESRFTWLVSNLDFSNCPSMKALPAHGNVKTDGAIVEVNQMKIGVFGIGLTPDKINGKVGGSQYPRSEDEVVAARRAIQYLRGRGAEFVVAVTHLSQEDDQALIDKLASQGLDLLVGGHDHTSMVLRDSAKVARGFKADSDGRTAWRIDVTMSDGGKPPRIEAQLIKLNTAIPPDINISELAALWSARAGKVICESRAKRKNEPDNPDCLLTTIGRTQSVIELEEEANRSQETGIGNWLADLIMEETGADVAIVNSGILGLNDDLPAGTELLLRHVIEIFRYDDVIAVRSFPAKQVCDALKHGFTRPGSGAWPHVGGVRVGVRKSSEQRNEVSAIRFKKPDVSCESSTDIKVAAVPFLLCGGDEYPLKANNLGTDKCQESIRDNPFNDPPDRKREGRRFSDVAEAKIRAAGKITGIEPENDGRVYLPKRETATGTPPVQYR